MPRYHERGAGRSSSNSLRRYFARVSEPRIISSDFLPCGDSFPCTVSNSRQKTLLPRNALFPLTDMASCRLNGLPLSFSSLCIDGTQFSVNRSSPSAWANTCPLGRRMGRLCAFSRKLEFVPSHDTTPEPSSPGRSCPSEPGRPVTLGRVCRLETLSPCWRGGNVRCSAP